MTQQEISDLIFSTWTTNQASGLCDFSTYPAAADMVRAQCDAVAAAIVAAGSSGTGEELVWQDPPDLFVAPRSVLEPCLLSHEPVPGSETVSLNGQHLEAGQDYSLDGATLTLEYELAGNDRLVVRYQWRY